MKRPLTIITIFALSLIAACRKPCPPCPPTPSPSIQSPGRAPLAKSTDVDIIIAGPTCFYMAKDGNGKYVNPMLLVLEDPKGKHTPLLVLPAMDTGQLMGAIGKSDCKTAPCVMGNYTIHVTDDGQLMTDDFKPSTAEADDLFDREVVHLQTEANPKFNDFTDDASDTTMPPKGHIVAALDLHGGRVVEIQEFTCSAHFDNSCPNVSDITPHPFARWVRVRYSPSKPGLSFLVGANDSRAVAFSGAGPYNMKINNKGVLGSHMHLFRQLSKSNVCLPEAVSESCMPDIDYLPGCANTQWP